MKNSINFKRITGLLAVAFLAIVAVSCNKQESPAPPEEEEVIIDTSYSRKVCGLVNPLNDLPWLRDIMTGKEKPGGNISSTTRIYAYRFKGQDVIYLLNMASSYNPWIVFTCDGNQIIPYLAPLARWKEFESERTDELLLWKGN